MEILSPASYLSSPNWLLGESRSTKWTPAENKMFENALAIYDKDTPDRWLKVAAMIPGKTVGDVIKQYKELEDDVSSIEAGLIPIPGYSPSPFTLEWGNGDGYNGFKQAFAAAGKRGASGRQSEQERKKGVPWTEEEHKLFLLGLKKYGKGDWRNISRNFVITRTPTQVASHAQKYFIRQLSGGKDKRRASIHDITTVNLNDDQTPSPESKRQPSPDQSSGVTQLSDSCPSRRAHFRWNQPSDGAAMGFSHSAQGNNIFMAPHGINSNSFGLNKMQAMNESSFIGAKSWAFQMQSAHHYLHG
ncbi:transcription factor DIVARICATA-like [Diospyros lotus]|uniref:transcription factor DIVARICATA-like n=1 Tax=Diospyros lotus TaxID=55363 RepID=UPI002254B68C|nr:transcription factor DIVARICATA-like [Diospyros lotus]